MRWLLGGFFSIVGLGALLLGLVTVLDGKASEDWPSVQGRLTRVDVKASTSGDSSRPTYTPDVEYEYEVGGQRYTGSRYEIIELGTGDRDAIAAKLAKFTVGDQVAVYYDPQSPTASVLRPGLPDAAWIPFVLGAVGLGVGLTVILVMKPAAARRRDRRVGRASREGKQT